MELAVLLAWGRTNKTCHPGHQMINLFIWLNCPLAWKCEMSSSRMRNLLTGLVRFFLGDRWIWNSFHHLSDAGGVQSWSFWNQGSCCRFFRGTAVIWRGWELNSAVSQKKWNCGGRQKVAWKCFGSVKATQIPRVWRYSRNHGGGF